MEWPGCVLICGAVLFPGVDGCASGLVWSLPAAPKSPFSCVCVHSQTCMRDNL